jgi:hypothetical protein
MTSTVQVQEKTVTNRDVVSFRKEYNGEEHEVFFPQDQATQVLLSLLTVVNDSKEGEEQLVLARKGDLANGGSSVSDTMVKETVVTSAVRELYDENTAGAVKTLLNGDSE